MAQPIDWRAVPRLVWLYEHDPEYRDHFDAIDGKAAPAPIAALAREQVNLCLYRECHVGCMKSRCYAKLQGSRFNPWEPYTEVTMRQCVSCVTGVS